MQKGHDTSSLEPAKDSVGGWSCPICGEHYHAIQQAVECQTSHDADTGPTDGRKPCLKCEGTGVGDSPLRPYCSSCDGLGYFLPPDTKAILQQVTTARGAKKSRRFRRSRPPRKFGDRAYFVWRLARFHGGADVCLPMVAEMAIEGDPWRDELEVFAGLLAKKVFGTDMAAASRWTGLVGPEV